ncbi:unnamed protein product [Vitrella brassicaformis CCMP3155]|uniref:Myb-like domain-containing protein n=4 Tax=Vitrella brassicaformis TaxID=1169539 RepID=A0A0G4ELT1_VITBC|nr:unnamed protein product [Vitrella brassicaformis CCMP3155]|eukprot:CEL97927.1 unnamed protein product [Vitrella brassicaformis CCMP3155]
MRAVSRPLARQELADEVARHVNKHGACLPPCEPPRLVRTPWDDVLQEMQWMAIDFYEERKWKVHLARRVSYMIKDHFRKLERQKVEHHAATCAAIVQSFWLGVTNKVAPDLMPADLKTEAIELDDREAMPKSLGPGAEGAGGQQPGSRQQRAAIVFRTGPRADKNHPRRKEKSARITQGLFEYCDRTLKALYKQHGLLESTMDGVAVPDSAIAEAMKPPPSDDDDDSLREDFGAFTKAEPLFVDIQPVTPLYYLNIGDPTRESCGLEDMDAYYTSRQHHFEKNVHAMQQQGALHLPGVLGPPDLSKDVLQFPLSGRSDSEEDSLMLQIYAMAYRNPDNDEYPRIKKQRGLDTGRPEGLPLVPNVPRRNRKSQKKLKHLQLDPSYLFHLPHPSSDPYDGGGGGMPSDDWMGRKPIEGEWLPDENTILERFVEIYDGSSPEALCGKYVNWGLIADSVNTAMGPLSKCRNSKMCQDQWVKLRERTASGSPRATPSATYASRVPADAKDQPKVVSLPPLSRVHRARPSPRFLPVTSALDSTRAFCAARRARKRRLDGSHPPDSDAHQMMDVSKKEESGSGETGSTGVPATSDDETMKGDEREKRKWGRDSGAIVPVGDATTSSDGKVAPLMRYIRGLLTGLVHSSEGVSKLMGDADTQPREVEENEAKTLKYYSAMVMKSVQKEKRVSARGSYHDAFKVDDLVRQAGLGGVSTSGLPFDSLERGAVCDIHASHYKLRDAAQIQSQMYHPAGATQEGGESDRSYEAVAARVADYEKLRQDNLQNQAYLKSTNNAKKPTVPDQLYIQVRQAQQQRQATHRPSHANPYHRHQHSPPFSPPPAAMHGGVPPSMPSPATHPTHGGQYGNHAYAQHQHQQHHQHRQQMHHHSHRGQRGASAAPPPAAHPPASPHPHPQHGHPPPSPYYQQQHMAQQVPQSPPSQQIGHMQPYGHPNQMSPARQSVGSSHGRKRRSSKGSKGGGGGSHAPAQGALNHGMAEPQQVCDPTSPSLPPSVGASVTAGPFATQVPPNAMAGGGGGGVMDEGGSKRKRRKGEQQPPPPDPNYQPYSQFASPPMQQTPDGMNAGYGRMAPSSSPQPYGRTRNGSHYGQHPMANSPPQPSGRSHSAQRGGQFPGPENHTAAMANASPAGYPYQGIQLNPYRAQPMQHSHHAMRDSRGGGMGGGMGNPLGMAGAPYGMMPSR